MFIQRIQLLNFRNFESVSVDFSPQVNFIIGRNAQGKTNLVEAVSFLSTGKSFRTNKLPELIRWGEKSASVNAEVRLSSGDLKLGMALTPTGREAYLNYERVKSASDLLGQILCVSFSPTDLALIKSSPELRRKFIDRHAVDLDPKLVKHVLTYYRALRNKAKLLREESPTLEMLRSWNELMAESAAHILKARWLFLRDLELTANWFYRQFSLEDGEIKLELKSNAVKNEGELTPDKVMEHLEKQASKEIAYQACIIGPHRDDLTIKIGGKDARSFASQGQTRSIVLALKLGVIALLEEKRGEAPIVLLDDVNSEFDQQRGDALIKMIFGQKRQIFITGTDAHIEEIDPGHEHLLLTLEKGALLKQPSAI